MVVQEEEMVTPGDVLGKVTEVKAGKGAYVAKHNGFVYASLTGLLRTLSPPSDSSDQRPTVEVTGHKAHSVVPELGSVVIARVTKVMARMASADIMCVGPKSVKEKFTCIIRQQDVRATEIDKVDMHLSFRPGDVVRALVLSLGDARSYFLSTAQNDLGVLSAESTAGGTMIPISWTEMQCPLTGQIEKRKVAKLLQWTTEMASSLLLLLLLPQPITTLTSSSSRTLFFHQSPHHVHPLTSLKITRKTTLSISKPHTVSFALTESDSSKSLQPSSQTLLQELANCFDLPSDYFAKLPGDLRLDLNDAAFDLSNGPVLDECGQELGETLLNLSRAWEKAETSTSSTLANKLPELESSSTDRARSAFGKRLISAGRRFQSMGQYGQGELQKIAKAMITTGKHLTANSVPTVTNEESKQETRMLKFGELQVEVTPAKAYIGALIGYVFGILSWELVQGIQAIPDSTLQYANDNALLLAKSLRGALIAIFYSSTILAAFTTVGLFVLARQLESKEK